MTETGSAPQTDPVDMPTAQPSPAPEAPATDGPAKNGESPPPAPNASPIVFFKDNLEAFAIAIVMALVIKHFCVEAFKIPTGSMEPTLIGDNHSVETDGDRILVNKFAYLFASPMRWDIPVFRYPLDRSRNFIKRIIGLPGERIRIYRGDIWTKRANDEEAPYRIARKNKRIRDGLYFRVYPPWAEDAEDLELSEVWTEEVPDGPWDLKSHDHYAFIGGDAAALVLKPKIHRSARADGWPHYGNSAEYTRDVRIKARLRRGTPRATTEGEEPPPTRVTLSWSPDGEWRVALTIATVAGESQAVLLRKGQPWKPPVPISAVLSTTRDLAVQLEFVDGDMRVWVGDEEIAVVPDERKIEESLPSGRNQELRIEAEGEPVDVRSFTIDRDLYYLDSFAYRSDWREDGIEVPEDAYFMLGDNTESSSDSRKWRVRTVYLRDGTEIQYDDSEAPNYLRGDSSRKYVTDVEGLRREWDEDDEDHERGSTVRNAPFVWRDLIVGRAFVIFWPLTPSPPGRLRFIH